MASNSNGLTGLVITVAIGLGAAFWAWEFLVDTRSKGYDNLKDYQDRQLAGEEVASPFAEKSSSTVDPAMAAAVVGGAMVGLGVLGGAAMMLRSPD